MVERKSKISSGPIELAPPGASGSKILFESQPEHVIPINHLPPKVATIVEKITENRELRLATSPALIPIALLGKKSLQLHDKLLDAIREHGLITQEHTGKYDERRFAVDFCKTHPYVIVRSGGLVLLKNDRPLNVEGEKIIAGKSKLDEQYEAQQKSKLRNAGLGRGYTLIKIGKQPQPAHYKPVR